MRTEALSPDPLAPRRLVAIGTSMGGLAALETVLSGLPTGFTAPVAVVQHRGARSCGVLAGLLQRYSSLRVREPQDKEPIAAGHVYIAPADYHLLVEPGYFTLSTEGPVSYARPSVDVLFETAADAYGDAVVAVVLTGANRDGAAGSARVKMKGGLVIVQDPETADCPMMPRAALAAVEADAVLSLAQIAARLVEICEG